MRTRFLTALLFLVLIPAVAAAQHLRRGLPFASGRGLAPQLGFGNINHPGLGFAPNTPGIGFPLRGRIGFGTPRYVYPFGFGLGYGWGGLPILTSDVAPQAPQAPVVIVIQAAPAHDPQPSPSAQATPAPSGKKVELTYEVRPRREEKQPHPLTLLVFKDQTLRAATRVWQEGGRLRYATSQGTQHTVSLDVLDLDFTRKLNHSRNIPFEF